MLRLFLGAKAAGARVPGFHRVLPGEAGDQAPPGVRTHHLPRLPRPAWPPGDAARRGADTAPAAVRGFHSTRVYGWENALSPTIHSSGVLPAVPDTPTERGS